MTRYTYPAIITYYPEDGGTYVVTFPDFPELEVADDNIVDALDGMNSMLSVYIDDIVGEGKPLPEPTTFEQHLHQDDNCISWWTIAHCDVDDLTVESMNEVLNRYRAQIATDNGIPADEAQAAFHANRPVISNLMRIVKSRLA